MIDILPLQKVKDLEELRETVNEKLNKKVRKEFPTFAKYFQSIIGLALQQEHPLDYWFIREIYADGDFTRLDETLESIEKFGESFLEDLFKEIEGQYCNADDLLFKLRSMHAEIDCARFLASSSGHIRKIPKSGDILFELNGQEWVFEVKNLLEEYISFECIADVLAGMMWWEDNDLLRFYKERIELKGNKINHRFRKKVIKFIHEDFIEELKEIERRIQSRSTEEYYVEFESLKIKIEVINDPEPQAIVDIVEDPRSMSLNMIRSSYQTEFYNISYIPPWHIGEPPDWRKVSEKLKKLIEAARKQLERRKNMNKGIFIRFDPQPEHEEVLIQDIEDPQGFLPSTIDECELPIVLYLPFRFKPPRYMLNEAARRIEFLREAEHRIAQEALLRLKGIGKSGLKDVGRQKHKYLSEATL